MPGINLIQGDCLGQLRNFPDKSVDIGIELDADYFEIAKARITNN